MLTEQEEWGRDVERGEGGRRESERERERENEKRSKKQWACANAQKLDATPGAWRPAPPQEACLCYS